MDLEQESVANRQLILDLTEKLRSFVEVTNAVTSRQAELIDTSVNRANENQLEIRGEHLQ
jgi:hypothetical protein